MSRNLPGMALLQVMHLSCLSLVSGLIVHVAFDIGIEVESRRE